MYINKQPRWREKELSVKQFQRLKSEEKNLYVEGLLKLVPEEISFNDEYIINFYTRPVKQKNFITLAID